MDARLPHTVRADLCAHGTLRSDAPAQEEV